MDGCRNWDDPGVIAGQAGDGFPIGVDGAIDNGGGDAEVVEGFQYPREVRRQPFVLQVVVGVEEN